MFEEAAVASILSLARLSLAKMDEFLELIWLRSNWRRRGSTFNITQRSLDTPNPTSNSRRYIVF
jgi:hypothetical protein